ncbi:MAG: EpsI family protein [Desulfobacterales bacterium]|nr:EpsI family protein [Desulfobacterales bacterium]
MSQKTIVNESILTYQFPFLVLICFISTNLSVFAKLGIAWESDDNNYCYLIVPLFLYLLWAKKDTFNFSNISWNPLGLVPVFISLLIMLLGELGSVLTLIYIGIWGCVCGLIFILYGWRVRKLIFPLLILLFIVPLPPYVNRVLTFQLKLAASTLSVLMMQLSGLSVLQEGNIIDLGISQLQVVDACSGLRYFMPLILMALLVGYFFCKGLWRQLILLAIVPPLSIFVNAIRIYATALLVVNGHEEMAEGFMHDFSGWLVFMVAAIILLIVALILKRIGKTKDNSKELGVRSEEDQKESNEQRVLSSEGESESTEQRVLSAEGKNSEEIGVRSEVEGESAERQKNSAKNRVNILKPLVITVILCALFIGSGWALKFLPFARNLPEKKTLLTNFPLQIENWQGESQYVTEEIYEALGADDYVKAVYSNPEVPNYINLLVPFYEYQGTRHAAHAPQSCILGSGWGLFKSEKKSIVLNPHEISVQSMIMEKDKMKMLAVYFFLQRGRVITNPWINKYYLMVDAITRQRTDGALVRAEMMINPGQTEEEAWDVMKSFLSEVYMILPEYVPN